MSGSGTNRTFIKKTTVFVQNNFMTLIIAAVILTLVGVFVVYPAIKKPKLRDQPSPEDEEDCEKNKTCGTDVQPDEFVREKVKTIREISEEFPNATKMGPLPARYIKHSGEVGNVDVVKEGGFHGSMASLL